MHEYSFHITSNLFGKSFPLLLAGQRFFLSLSTARQTLPRHLNCFLCLLFALTTTRCFARISWRTTLDYTSPLRRAQLFHHRSFHSQRRQEREERRRRMEAEIAREGTAEPTAASGTDDIAKVLFFSLCSFSLMLIASPFVSQHIVLCIGLLLFSTFQKEKKILFCISEYKIVNHTHLFILLHKQHHQTLFLFITLLSFVRRGDRSEKLAANRWRKKWQKRKKSARGDARSAARS